MNFGNQSVILRRFVANTDRGRLNQGGRDPVESPWMGVLMRPLRSTEQVTLTDISTATWRCTGAAVAAALNMTEGGELDYQGVTYQVVAVEPFSDLSGVVDHVRITCQRQDVRSAA